MEIGADGQARQGWGDHVEKRLLVPRRHTERQRGYISELRKCASEADAKLIRLYEAIENGAADTSDPALKGRIAELSAIRDQARTDAERAAGVIERAGLELTEEKVKAFTAAARKRLRDGDGTYRRNHFRAAAAHRSDRQK